MGFIKIIFIGWCDDTIFFLIFSLTYEVKP